MDKLYARNNAMNEIQDCFQAGYNLSNERPPWPSSTVYMAYQSGVWCRKHGINPLEVKQSRGYTMIVNRTYKLNFKNDNDIPDVTTV